MKCEICNLHDDDVLIRHHIDSNRKNNNPDNIIILCANCHLRTHKRNFRKKYKTINLKSEIFNDQRLKLELIKLKERDYKVNKYLYEKYGF